MSQYEWQTVGERKCNTTNTNCLNSIRRIMQWREFEKLVVSENSFKNVLLRMLLRKGRERIPLQVVKETLPFSHFLRVRKSFRKGRGILERKYDLYLGKVAFSQGSSTFVLDLILGIYFLDKRRYILMRILLISLAKRIFEKISTNVGIRDTWIKRRVQINPDEFSKSKHFYGYRRFRLTTSCFFDQGKI